jgi:hypothetical protein
MNFNMLECLEYAESFDDSSDLICNNNAGDRVVLASYWAMWGKLIAIRKVVAGRKRDWLRRKGMDTAYQSYQLRC